MGELQHEAFQFTFNGFLKVAFQGSRVTSDAGLILVRSSSACATYADALRKISFMRFSSRTSRVG